MLTPAASVVAVAGAWLGPVTPDERAALLTAAAAASTLAALRTPTRTAAPASSTPAPSRAKRVERVDDLAALIAAW